MNFKDFVKKYCLKEWECLPKFQQEFIDKISDHWNLKLIQYRRAWLKTLEDFFKKYMIQKIKKVKFKYDKSLYNVMAKNDRYIICSRKLNRRQDAKMIWDRVEVHAYDTFTCAYEDLKDSPVYTIIDLKEEIRWADNLVFWIHDYFSKKDCHNALDMLNKWEMEVSSRNNIDLDIEWIYL